MVYEAGRKQLNDMERTSGGATKQLDMGTVEAGLVTGDVVILGALPRESITNDIRILVAEAFDGTAPAFDLGYYDYNSGTFVAFAVVAAAALGTKDRSIVVSMPTTGQIDSAGVAYTGNRGAIWNGQSETILAIQWKGGATSPTKGQAHVVTSHTYYGTKDGQYGLAKVPMKPYKQ